MKIVADQSLHINADDLGMRIIEGYLHAPPEVVRILNDLGVVDSDFLISTIEQMPSAFIQKLAIDMGQLERLKINIGQRYLLNSSESGQKFEMPPLGAMPGE